MATTTLSTILSRMDRFQVIQQVEEQYKVRDLDEAIRGVRRQAQLPWTLQKGSLRVFDGVLEYPVASDHDELAYLDRDGDSPLFRYEERARFRFTSLQQFYEDLDYRNDLAEIWDGNTRYLGVRLALLNVQGSTLVNNGETVGQFTASGDAASPTLDTVTFREGAGSIKITITNSAGTATVTNTESSALNDSNIKKKFYFRSVFLADAAVPASIELRFGSSSANYYSSGALTAQFSGQAFKRNAWNTLAFNIDTAAQTGTVNTSSLNFEAIIFTGAQTGSYFIDASYLREWELLDYWYYSTQNVALASSTTANQDFFYNSNGVYSTDSKLVGDLEYADVVMYDALLSSLTDKDNDSMYQKILARRNEAWQALLSQYPSYRQLMTTQRYRFLTDFNLEDNSIWSSSSR